MKHLKQFELFEAIRNFNQQEVMDWLKERKDFTFIALDTETTGLGGAYVEQLTQIAAVAYDFNFETLTFDEISDFNEKIKLTPGIKARMASDKLLPPDSQVRKVTGALKFNRYGEKGATYLDEQDVLQHLEDFISQFDKVVLLIQNAPFDMKLINIRRQFGGFNHEVFDTKDFFAYFLIPTLQVIAEKDPEAASIIAALGKTGRGNVPSSSLPVVSKALGVDPNGAHDALYDCRYMVETLEKGLEILSANTDLAIKDYQRPRYEMEKYFADKARAENKKSFYKSKGIFRGR
jgi:DNA polymerase III epsilon subunit-like protein